MLSIYAHDLKSPDPVPSLMRAVPEQHDSACFEKKSDRVPKDPTAWLTWGAGVEYRSLVSDSLGSDSSACTCDRAQPQVHVHGEGCMRTSVSVDTRQPQDEDWHVTASGHVAGLPWW